MTMITRELDFSPLLATTQLYSLLYIRFTTVLLGMNLKVATPERGSDNEE